MIVELNPYALDFYASEYMYDSDHLEGSLVRYAHCEASFIEHSMISCHLGNLDDSTSTYSYHIARRSIEMRFNPPTLQPSVTVKVVAGVSWLLKSLGIGSSSTWLGSALMKYGCVSDRGDNT